MEEILSEDYCSYELSKLLKEKGFDGECVGCYWDSKKIFDINYEPLSYSDGDLRDEVILAPTHQMAMKWLREVHKLHVEIDVYEGIKYAWSLSHADSGEYVIDPLKLRDKGYPTYEEAVEAALKYVLENLI